MFSPRWRARSLLGLVVLSVLGLWGMCWAIPRWEERKLTLALVQRVRELNPGIVDLQKRSAGQQFATNVAYETVDGQPRSVALTFFDVNTAPSWLPAHNTAICEMLFCEIQEVWITDKVSDEEVVLLSSLPHLRSIWAASPDIAGAQVDVIKKAHPKVTVVVEDLSAYGFWGRSNGTGLIDKRASTDEVTEADD